MQYDVRTHSKASSVLHVKPYKVFIKEGDDIV